MSFQIADASDEYTFDLPLRELSRGRGRAPLEFDVSSG
jgi:hypothetical protein